MNDRNRPRTLTQVTAIAAALFGVAGATSAQDCVFFDDFEDNQPEPTWTEADSNANRLRVAEVNERVECWGPSSNNGGTHISILNGSNWFVDMESDWAVSISFHVNAVHPSNGEISIGFYLTLEGNLETPSIRDGIALTLGTADYGTGLFDFQAVRAWDDGIGYVITTDNRSYTNRTIYFWYDASVGCFSYGYDLYDDFHTICGVDLLSNETTATIGIGGISIGDVPSSSGNRLWGDDLCVIEGNIVGPAVGGCCVDGICFETLEAGCTGMWLGEGTDCLGSDPCAPDPLHVPGDYATIQAAIDAAIDGDEIIVAPGVHLGKDSEVFNTIGKQLFIHSSDGPATTFINGESVRRVFVCDSGETLKTVIDGFSLIDGTDPEQGGAIRIMNGSSPTIQNCNVRYSSANRGGGASIEDSYPSFIGCTFSDNDSAQEGAAIDASGSSLFLLTDCLVEFNTAGNGDGFAAINMRDTARAVLSGTVVCDNIPTDVVGDWEDAGGNTVCNKCLGDLTGDGIINGGDLTVVLGFWGTCANPKDCLADMTGDGVVNGADLTIILGFWGPCR